MILPASGVLSASCYFRGNYMTASAVERLLMNLCELPDLIPEYWNVFEPVNIPFDQNKIADVVKALAPSSRQVIRSGAFFTRKKTPRCLLSVGLYLAHFQGTTAHNRLSHLIYRRWPGGEHRLAQYVSHAIWPKVPDYASVPEWSQDRERYNELRQPMTPAQFAEMVAKQKKVFVAPFGPHGCLADIHWFNFFGSAYVEFIGRDRLLRAGWAQAQEVGDGLACYSTEHIDDQNSREQRDRIVRALEEFVWTPGCKREEKRVPEFDFTEQLSALPPDVRAKLDRPTPGTRITFAGLSESDQQKAIRSFEGAGMTFDPATRILTPPPDEAK